MGDEFEVPSWLDRVLDRAVGLEGQRRRWFGVWVQRFRRYCRELGHDGLGFVPLARGYLEGLLITPGVEDWQREQAREALRLCMSKSKPRFPGLKPLGFVLPGFQPDDSQSGSRREQLHLPLKPGPQVTGKAVIPPGSASRWRDT